jgi:hypothetical protein
MTSFRVFIKPCSLFLACLFLGAGPSLADERHFTETPANQQKIEEPAGRSIIVATLLYVPNRVLDLFDILRFRVRVGPGAAAGVRVTELAEIFVGSYTSVYVGLPGPRMESTVSLPFGLESHNGVSASVVDATVDGGIGPNYSPTEVAIGTQLLLLGFDIGIDPVEIADFAAGILTLDLRDDDL